MGTSAWTFLILNVCKVPFNDHLGLITADSLRLNLCLLPGVLGGRWLLHRISQRGFQPLLPAFALLASLRLLWG